jgi:prepilin-type N-terminal cleavage/methylation domain-containing protein
VKEERMQGSSAESGFSLIELMIAVTCIAVLAAIAAPRVKGYVLEARLNGAKPYLMEIAAKSRMYRIETGKYCCSGYTTFNETTLSNNLGLSLAEAGDFCFMLICRDAAVCEAPVTTGFIAPATSVPDFEVWAVLRNSTATTVTGPGSTVCTVASGKASPTGWVAAATPTTNSGRVGQVVALRYPSPVNGLSDATGTYHAIKFDWRDGISLSDAMLP